MPVGIYRAVSSINPTFVLLSWSTPDFFSSAAWFLHTAVHCNLSQNGIDHQMCPEDMTSQLEEEEESVDAGPVLLDDDSPVYHDLTPPMYHCHPPPQRSVSESELSRVREASASVQCARSTRVAKSSAQLCIICQLCWTRRKSPLWAVLSSLVYFNTASCKSIWFKRHWMISNPVALPLGGIKDWRREMKMDCLK